MSLRSASRVARSVRLPAAFAPRAPVIARRAASTGEHHTAPGSDLPWAIGSAVVFIPALGYFLTKKDDAHHEHAADAILDLPTDQFGNKGDATEFVETGAEAAESDKEGAESVGLKGAVEEAKNTAEEKVEEAKGKAEEVVGSAKDKAGEAKEAAEKKVEDVKEGAKDVKEDVKKGAEDVKEGAKDVAEDAKEGAEETAADIKESLQKAEKSDAPQSG